MKVEAQRHSKAVTRYLARIHQQLDAPWNVGVRQLASQLRPARDPLNDPLLAAIISIRFRPQGMPHLRVRRPSGDHRFDNSALRLLSRVRWPQQPPSLRFGEVELLWSFFRDGRGCSTRYVAVRARPLDDLAAFRLALHRGHRQRAWELLQRNRADHRLIDILVRRGLTDQRQTTQVLALELADSATLGAILEDYRRPEVIWQTARRVLQKRRAWSRLKAALAGLVKPLYGWRPDPPLRLARTPGRALALLRGLRAHGVTIAPSVVREALEHGSPSVVRAVAPIAKDPALLGRALRRAGLSRDLFALLQATRVAHQRPQSSQARWARKLLEGALLRLRGEQRSKLVDALIRWPVAACGKDLATLLGREITIREQAQLLRAYGPVAQELGPFWRGLRDNHVMVRRAAVEGLGRHPRAGLGVGYRLGHLGYKEPSLRPQVVVALARIAHPRFDKDLQFLAVRLPAAAKLRLIDTLAKTRKWPLLVKALRRGATTPALLARLDAPSSTNTPGGRVVTAPASEEQRLHRLLLAVTVRSATKTSGVALSVKERRAQNAPR